MFAEIARRVREAYKDFKGVRKRELIHDYELDELDDLSTKILSDFGLEEQDPEDAKALVKLLHPNSPQRDKKDLETLWTPRYTLERPVNLQNGVAEINMTKLGEPYDFSPLILGLGQMPLVLIYEKAMLVKREGKAYVEYGVPTFDDFEALYKAVVQLLK